MTWLGLLGLVVLYVVAVREITNPVDGNAERIPVVYVQKGE
jgi:hypothetical protein